MRGWIRAWWTAKRIRPLWVDILGTLWCWWMITHSGLTRVIFVGIISSIGLMGIYLNVFYNPLQQSQCPHPEHRQRCIHGDEINAAGGKRAQCLDCGKFLQDLPYRCTTTGDPHRRVPRVT